MQQLQRNQLAKSDREVNNGRAGRVQECMVENVKSRFCDEAIG